MRDLTEIRQQIDQIDQKMLALFKERMGCSVEVAEYKRGTGKAIYDPVRERQKIDALTKDEDELIIKKSVEEMFLQMMSISRRYQYSLLSQEDAYIDQTFEEVEELDINDCLFEIRADNGYYDWNNDLLDDDMISYRPYYLEKVEDVGIVVEMTTMRLLEHKKVYLTLTRKSDGKELMRIDLIPYLLLTKMEGHNIPAQEYLDRQSEYAIVFFYNPELLNFLSTKIVINGWTIWLKGEDL